MVNDLSETLLAVAKSHADIARAAYAEGFKAGQRATWAEVNKVLEADKARDQPALNRPGHSRLSQVLPGWPSFCDVSCCCGAHVDAHVRESTDPDLCYRPPPRARDRFQQGSSTVSHQTGSGGVPGNLC